jgi:hypothetical protein
MVVIVIGQTRPILLPSTATLKAPVVALVSGFVEPLQSRLAYLPYVPYRTIQFVYPRCAVSRFDIAQDSLGIETRSLYVTILSGQRCFRTFKPEAVFDLGHDSAPGTACDKGDVRQ